MEFRGSEIALKHQIDQLHTKWKAHLVKSAQSSVTADLIKELYIKDGFYPEYTQQNKKILFIGKEGLELGGNDYIEKLFTAYHTKFIGETYPRPINSYQFHSTMLYIAYAVNYKVYNWEHLPWASEIVERFGTPDGTSFAFMNLSKFSNESGAWQAAEELIDSFLKLSLNPDYDFFAHEINILDPDIIISMNLEERMKYMGTFSNPKWYGEKKHDVCYQILTTSLGKQYPLLDTWHFSAPNKSPEKNIFQPVMEALKDNKII